MLKSFFSLLLIIATCTNIQAQALIKLDAYKEKEKIDGKWTEWSAWTAPPKGEGTKLQITKGIAQNGEDMYTIVLYPEKLDAADGTSITVVYDDARTKEAMKEQEWKDEDVYCYREVEYGDYIYSTHVTLEELDNDDSLWIKRPRSRLYFYIDSENYRLLVK